MGRVFCDHDRVRAVAEWNDTAGRPWSEHECLDAACGLRWRLLEGQPWRRRAPKKVDV